MRFSCVFVFVLLQFVAICKSIIPLLMISMLAKQTNTFKPLQNHCTRRNSFNKHEKTSSNDVHASPKKKGTGVESSRLWQSKRLNATLTTSFLYITNEFLSAIHGIYNYVVAVSNDSNTTNSSWLANSFHRAQMRNQSFLMVMTHSFIVYLP